MQWSVFDDTGVVGMISTRSIVSKGRGRTRLHENKTTYIRSRSSKKNKPHGQHMKAKKLDVQWSAFNDTGAVGMLSARSIGSEGRARNKASRDYNGIELE